MRHSLGHLIDRGVSEPVSVVGNTRPFRLLHVEQPVIVTLENLGTYLLAQTISSAQIMVIGQSKLSFGLTYSITRAAHGTPLFGMHFASVGTLYNLCDYQRGHTRLQVCALSYNEFAWLALQQDLRLARCSLDVLQALDGLVAHTADFDKDGLGPVRREQVR